MANDVDKLQISFGVIRRKFSPELEEEFKDVLGVNF